MATPKATKSRFFKAHRDSVLSHNSDGSPNNQRAQSDDDDQKFKSSSMPPAGVGNVPSLIARRQMAQQGEGVLSKYKGGVDISAEKKKNGARLSIQSPGFLNEYKYKKTNMKNAEIKDDEVLQKIFSGGLPEVIRKQVEKSKMNNYKSDSFHTEQSEDLDNSSFTDTNTDDVDPQKQITMRKFKKGLLSVYFVGIMLSVRNTMKVIGSQKHRDNANDKDKGFKTWCYIFPIMPTNKCSIYWTISIAALIILTAILTPFKVSFIEDDNKPFQTIELIFDIGFGIDIFINFVSAYYHPRLGLITEFRKIAKNYLSGWFWIDVVAILPFDTIIQGISGQTSDSSYNKLLRLLRFPRLYRLLKILRLFKMAKLFSTNQTFTKFLKKLNLNLGLIKMMKVLVNILFLNHLVGCLFFFIARVEDFNPNTWVSRYNLIDEDAWTQYIASYYWAFQTLTTVGYGDIAPLTTAERIIAIIWMMVGVGFYSFTIGNLSTILAHIDRRSSALKNTLTSFNNFALKVKLPEFLRQKVQRFFEINHKENVYYWIDPQAMLDELPLILRNSMLLHAYYHMIKNISILQKDSNFTAHILTSFKMLKLMKKEILYREEDPSQEVYFIQKGQVVWVNEDGDGLITFLEGTYFGEIEVLNNNKRMCFCQASKPTVLLVCDKKIFLEALNKYGSVKSEVDNTANVRKQKLDKVAQSKKNAKQQAEQPNQQENEDQPQPEKSSKKKKKLLKSTAYFYHVVLKNIKQRGGQVEPQQSQQHAQPRPSHLRSVDSSMYGGTVNNSFVNDNSLFTNRNASGKLGSLLPQRRTLDESKISKVLGHRRSESTGLMKGGAKPQGGMLQKILNLGKQGSSEAEQNPATEPPSSQSKIGDQSEDNSLNPLGVHISRTSPNRPNQQSTLQGRLSNILTLEDPPEKSIKEADLHEEISPNMPIPRIGSNSEEVKDAIIESQRGSESSRQEPVQIQKLNLLNDDDYTDDIPRKISSKSYEPSENYIGGEDGIIISSPKKEQVVEFFANYSGNYDNPLYLAKLKDGFNLINKLKEHNDEIINHIGEKRESVIQQFSTISDKQVEIQQKVDRLLKG